MRPLTDHDHVIRIEGELDRASACALVSAAAALPPGDGFVVDVSEAAGVDDFALALLASALAGTRPFRLRGLSVHHERLLEYLGLASRAGARQPRRVNTAAA